VLFRIASGAQAHERISTNAIQREETK